MFEFNGGYNRVGTIEIKNDKCLVCKEKKNVLCIDSSEGEYATGKICFDCIEKMRKKYNT